jgi:signal transduction histidine kinase
VKTRTASRLAWTLWAVIPIVLVVVVLIIVFTDFTVAEEMPGVVIVPVFLFAFATVGTLVASRRPDNAIGWIMLGTGVGWGIAGLGDTYAGYAAQAGLTHTLLARLGDWTNYWFYIVGLFLPITLLLLLFPTGSPPSPRWRPVIWVAAIGNVLLAFSLAFNPANTASDTRFLESNPFGIRGAHIVFLVSNWIGWWLSLGAFIASAIGIGLRMRRARGDERAQLKWLTASGCFVVLAMLVVIFLGSALGWPDDSIVVEIVVLGSLTLIPVTAGIAILKYRLYDIDVVINRAVVYGALAVFITIVYVAIVVGIGTLVGSGGSAFLSAVAAAVVALLFQPLRRRAQHVANRVVYGERATPYEVLSGFSERLGDTYSLDDVLPRVARVLGEGIGAERVSILLGRGARAVPVASWPDDDLVSTSQRSFEVRHQGDTLGEIRISMPVGDAIDASRERLAADVAAQAGLVLRNASLVTDLRDSRRRIVAAQDERARKLERNIHDGAQQQLVAVAVKLGLVERVVRTDAAAAEAMVAEAKVETSDALENLRDLARGIYPPLLADQGLAAALRSQARKAAIPVEVEPDGIGRYPEETEAAVYFSCLEALQNVAKYAAASSATVRLAQSNGSLTFEVVDDGRGFDPEAAERGSGLQGIADRLAALGGTLTVRSAPGEGTTIGGSLPVQVNV